MSKKGLILAGLRRQLLAGGGDDIAGSFDMDGANDYLSRGSDLTGNADGKTFTFSCWFWLDASPNATGGLIYSTFGRFGITVSSTGAQIGLRALTSGDSYLIDASLGSGNVSKNTWNHLLVSVDLANSSNRKVYMNDRDVTASMSWSTYINGTIDFTVSQWFVGSTNAGATQRHKGRLAHVYLDYTYRDLSIEANRRLFITDDLKPVAKSSLAALSPIGYWPMDDPTVPGLSLGTGGDMALTGVVARSGRGPNQYNPAASTYDTGDSLNLTSFAGPITSGYTCHFNLKSDLVNQSIPFWTDHGSVGVNVQFSLLSSGVIRMYMYDHSTSTNVINISANTSLVAGKYYSVQFVVDTVTSGNCKIVVNGVDQAVTVNTFVSRASHDISNIARVQSAGSGHQVSDVWFHPTYIDLSANNPFYDTETGKAKDLGANGELPTGSAPLIYLPMRADDAGRDASGNGNHFTVNSGPFVGARGPNEFWANSALFVAASSQRLACSAFDAGASSKTVSFAFSIKRTDSATSWLAALVDNSNFRNDVFDILFSTDSLHIRGGNSAGTRILDVRSTSEDWTSDWVNVLFSCDLNNSSNRSLYIGGDAASPTWEAYSNDSICFAETTRASIAAAYDVSFELSARVGFFYFSTEYIDFSEETNRLKFFDAFGYPVDLGVNGELPTGTAPLIYMNKDIHLGTDSSGRGNNFTPVGTPTDGGFVKG